jgi:hypothetical protein
METESELKAMIGTTGSEILNLCTLDNCLYPDWQLEELLKSQSPRIQSKIKKSTIRVSRSWTWARQSSRFGYGWNLVKVNVIDRNLATMEIINGQS